MTIRSYAFDASTLGGGRCFKIPQMPTASIFMPGDVIDAIKSAELSGFEAELVWEAA